MTDIVERLRALEAWIRKPTGEPYNMNTDMFDDAADEITALRADNERQAAELRSLRAALKPSAETKAAYIGEFHITEEGYDEDGQVYYRKVAVPWTIIKEIMAAISARAALEAK